jgi:hypothetical protein
MLLDFINSNQSLLETLIIVGLITAVVGVVLVMFWQYIIFGLLGLFCVVVLANHKSPEKPKEEIVPLSGVQRSYEHPDRKHFMEDCFNLTEYSEKHCSDIWENRENDDEKL